MADDCELWNRIRRGESQAFEAFYRETGPRLLGYLYQIVGNRQAAEDVMQETFTQLWKNPNNFSLEKGTLRAYLFGIARKHAAEWWRKRRQATERKLEEPAECKTDIVSLVGDALERLPEEQRSLLWLREVEGHSYQELAQILEIPVGTVRSRLFTAREGLRTVWHATLPVIKEVR